MASVLQICPGCGSSLDLDSRFCGVCGNELVGRLSEQNPPGTLGQEGALAVSPTESPSELPSYRAQLDSSVVENSERDMIPENAALQTQAPRSRRWYGVLLVGLVLLSLGAGYGGFLWWQKQTHKVDVIVEQTDLGQMLFIKPYPHAIGMRVRFGGRELLLGPEGVRFALDVDSMKVGANHVVLFLIDRHGRGKLLNATILIPYRVHFDRQGLNQIPMTLDFVIDVLPHSNVSVDGQPLVVDAHGKGTKRYVIQVPEDSETSYEHVVHYSIEPKDSRPIEGVLRAHIQPSALRVDAPIDMAVTQGKSIDVAGAVHAQAKLTINGQPIAVRDGLFQHIEPLAELGMSSIEIVAHEPMRLPRRIVRRVYRVANLKHEATRFRADPRITYRLIAEDPIKYRGQHIRIVGRVFNVDVENGQNMLQMQARECDHTPCPLWVTLPTLMQFEPGSMITVLGVVTGTQTFRTYSGKVSKIPRIDAILAVPL